MILQALHKLAQDEQLVADPDYEPRPVAWLIRIDEAGKLLGIAGTHTTPSSEGKKKPPKPVPKTFNVPRQPIRTSGISGFFLCDKAEYVFGIEPKPDPKKKPKSRERLEGCMAVFREQVEDCARETGDPGAKAVLSFLQDIASGRQTALLPEECENNDLFAFVFDPDVDLCVHDRAAVRAFWKRQRSDRPDAGESPMRCLVTGEPVAQPGNFDQIKKVPGKNTAKGVSLVSFNAKAFESYGWERNENAPISQPAAEACATALNRLLHPEYHVFTPTERTLPRRHLRLSADTAMCYWAANAAGTDFCNVFAALLEANPEEVAEMYHGLWRGFPPAMDNPSAFYAVTLTGTQGRIIVRDWFESTVADVAGNLAGHFRDTHIARVTPPPKERPLPPGFPLRTLLEALADPAENRKEGIPAPLARQFLHAALSAGPYPMAAMQRAMLRYRMELSAEHEKNGWWQAKNMNDARAAIVKAVLNRRSRAYQNSAQFKEVLPEMDPENMDTGYLLGRLMACIERMQQLAIKDVNASVVDRFFSGASASPHSVFPRLMKNLQHHARKARDDAKAAGTARWLQAMIDDIVSKLQSFPTHLSLDQQGLFIIGYHHQRHAFWTKRNKPEESAASDATDNQ